MDVIVVVPDVSRVQTAIGGSVLQVAPAAALGLLTPPEARAVDPRAVDPPPHPTPTPPQDPTFDPFRGHASRSIRWCLAVHIPPKAFETSCRQISGPSAVQRAQGAKQPQFHLLAHFPLLFLYLLLLFYFLYCL